jgi:peptidoglycan/xylan/chitin deacetylase (PgdA/CDA1 family)
VNFEVLKRQVATPLCRLLTSSGLYRAAAPVFGGIGSIFNLHRVLPRSKGKRVPSVGALEVTPEWLDESIGFCRANGIEIISPSRMCGILDGIEPPCRFVVYTFDDGYEDNYTHGYPVFRKHGAPFTIYLTASFPEKQFIPWWLLLEDLILRDDTCRCMANGRRLAFDVTSDTGRETAFYELRALILEGCRTDYRGTLEQVFLPNGIDIEKYGGLGLTWDQVREMSRDPLVTIGAHGLKHVPLGKVTDSELKLEVTEAREIIEAHIGVPVDHFAFPYGARGEAGQREFDAAESAGYKSAVTTRPANIFPEHRNHRYALPRNMISGEREGRNIDFLRLWFSGTIPALENRFRRVVTV